MKYRTLEYKTEPAANNTLKCSPLCPWQITHTGIAIGSTACKHCESCIEDDWKNQVVKCSFMIDEKPACET